MKYRIVLIACAAQLAITGCGKQDFQSENPEDTAQEQAPPVIAGTRNSTNEDPPISTASDYDQKNTTSNDEVQGAGELGSTLHDSGQKQIQNQPHHAAQTVEQRLYINRVCRPLDATFQPRTIEGVAMAIYPHSGANPVAINDPNINRATLESLLTTSSLPAGLFRDFPDGSYTVMFCDDRAPGACQSPAQALQRIVSRDLYTQNLTTLTNEPLQLLSWFGNFMNRSDARVGGIPVLRIQGGAPLVPEKARSINYGLKISVQQLGVILDPRSGVGLNECVHSPLVLDLDNSGLEFSAPSQGVRFDIDGDGQSETISWPTGRNAAFLVLDRNGNGSIDGAQELFGNYTRDQSNKRYANGFDALARFDENRDGSITTRDSVYKKLRLWRDLDRNGRSDHYELFTLASEQVVRIDLKYRDRGAVDPHGNIAKQASTFYRSHGKPGVIVDMWFVEAAPAVSASNK